MEDITQNVAALLPAVATNLVIEERSIPSPGPDEVLIHNHFIGLNPIDWKRQAWGFMINSYPTILGADVCGIVAKVGSNVTGFKPGDRVVGLAGSFSSGNIDHAAYQRYTIVKSTRTGKLPQETNLQQGAAVVTAVGAASMAFFDVLGFSLPTGVDITKPRSVSPIEAILIWGGASNVGAMAIQIARLLGLTVFTTASEHHHSHLRSLGASVVIDYHSSTIVDDLLAAAKKSGKEIVYAIDTISQSHTLEPTSQVLTRAPGNGKIKKKLAHLTPWPQNFSRPESIDVQQVESAYYFDRRDDLAAWLYNDTLARWLQARIIIPGRYRVIQGLSGIQSGLDELRKGLSREKLIVEV